MSTSHAPPATSAQPPLARTSGVLRSPTLWVLPIVALAAALRLYDLGGVRLDPFYDAAVRSMSLSWHNFFFGAYEPGGSVSIDKPPIDLWLQVASVKLLGWSSTALKLPAALAGTAAVPLLYAAIRRPFGALAGLLAALALAVLPIEVITARSDTMDAVMMLLLVVSLYALVRACGTDEQQGTDRSEGVAGPDNPRAAAPHSTAWLLASAAALGIAFNVKLLESTVALPGLLVLAWLGLPQPPRARAARLATAACVYVAVSLAWLSATLLFPASSRPFAIGSTNGSAWNAAFVFNGTERLSGKTTEVGQASASVPATLPAHGARTRHGGAAASGPRVPESEPIAPPSPTRLLARSGQLPARWLGWEALTALLLGAFACLFSARGGTPRWGVPASPVGARQRRVARACTAGIYVWLVCGVVLFSAMARLHPRYVESFTPAVAATLAIGIAWVVASARSRARWLALVLVALLAVPLAASVQAVRAKTTDAGDVGALRPAEQRALSAYLLAHQGNARYELAAGSATSVASLIVQDVRPVLMLTTYNGLALTSVAQLRSLAARGEVRYAFLDSVCGPHPEKTVAGCAPAALWIRAHGTDVSRQARLSPGVLWRLPATARNATQRRSHSRRAVSRRAAQPDARPALVRVRQRVPFPRDRTGR